jgi:hypothetical protein
MPNLEELVYEALRDGADEATIVAILKGLAKEKRPAHATGAGLRLGRDYSSPGLRTCRKWSRTCLEAPPMAAIKKGESPVPQAHHPI